MSLRVEKDTPTIYTSSLLNQELHPVPRKPLGNPLSNQTRLQHTIHQSSDLEPFKKHTHFDESHTKSIDLDHLKNTQHSLATQHQEYRRLRRDYTCLKNNLKSIQMQSYSTLFENPKLWCECSNLESTLSQLKNSNMFLLLVWKHKQTIYIFQRLVKAFNEGAYSVENHLKHIQPPKQNFFRIFKKTIGWNHETTDCLVW